jgi:transcriptional regulator with XRE-family HTH domain
MTDSQISLTRAIGERLRYARESAGMSLSALSERTGGRLSKSRISNYELGLRRMSIETARILAEAFGTVTPTYLLCLEDPMGLTPDELELLAQYRASDPQGRIEIRSLVANIRGGARSPTYTDVS